VTQDLQVDLNKLKDSDADFLLIKQKLMAVPKLRPCLVLKILIK
jgi:hypothetical protein